MVACRREMFLSGFTELLPGYTVFYSVDGGLRDRLQVRIMPSSKTDTAIRLPEREDQQRRLRNVTQDRKWAAQMEAQRRSSKQKAEDSTTWTPQQMLAAQIDPAGQPVPDPATTADGAKERRKKGSVDEDSDMYEAMNAEYD